MNNAHTARLSLALALLSSGCSSSGNEDVTRDQQEIIAGDLPTSHGALQNWGVVTLGGCTGTLISNQYVLTAHHCARNEDGLTNPHAALEVPVVPEVPTGLVEADTAVTYEDSTSVTLNAADFALLELNVPLSVNGSDDALFNPIYAGTDASLLNKSVFCMGYGGTVEATSTTFASGFGTLTSATMTISSVGAGTTLRPRNGSGQVGFGGDSGSTCFLNGAITGVQSTCGYNTWHDLNGDGKDDRWSERADTTGCTNSAPSNFRTFVNNIVRADASVSATFAPPLAAGTVVIADVSTPVAQDQAKTITNGWASSKYALRSGYFAVSVREPAGFMCPAGTKRRTPLTGSVDVNTTCLGDGVVSSIL